MCVSVSMGITPEFGITPRDIQKRTRFAENPLWNRLLRIRETDPYHSLERADDHLESGGSMVYLSTHPSIEDAARAALLLARRPAVAKRHVLVPAAIHQMWLVNRTIAPYLGIEAVPIITQHSLEKGTYSVREQFMYLRRYIDRLADVLSHNGVAAGAFQADQEPRLEPPKKRMIKLIFDITDRYNIDNVGFVFMGIDIVGRDIQKSRNLTLVRYPYHFTVGRFFLKDEFRREADRADLTLDQFAYRQFIPLVPAAYRSE